MRVTVTTVVAVVVVALLLLQQNLLSSLLRDQIAAAHAGRASPIVTVLLKALAGEAAKAPLVLFQAKAKALVTHGWALGLLLLLAGVPLALRFMLRHLDEFTFGLCLGWLLLSRQWGFLVLIGIGVFVILLYAIGHSRRAVGLRWAFSGSPLALLMSGWFYISLFRHYGTPTAFNLEPAARFSLFNQPLSFYFGLGDGHLFTDPIRGSFNSQFLPIFYSEIWGDYWCYFSANARATLNTVGEGCLVLRSQAVMRARLPPRSCLISVVSTSSRS